MERKRNKNGKNEFVNLMGQHGRNNSQQIYGKNKR